MANSMRLVWDNAADRGTLTASSATITSANLLTDSKTEVWRNGHLAGSLNTSWVTPELVSCVSLPYTNCSSTTVMRVRATNESSVTNLLTYSEHLLSWNANGDTGTLAFYKMAPDGVGATNYINSGSRYRGLTLVAGQTYTFSEFVKPITATAVALYRDGTGAIVTATFNFASKTFSSVSSGVSCGYTEMADGWFRVWMTHVVVNPASNFHVFPQGGGLEAWGFMVALGGITSYYPTTQTIASRATTATYTGVNGYLLTAASGAARMQYQYPSLATVAPRLLVEGSATNDMRASQQINNSTYWYLSANANVTPDPVTAPLAPDNTQTMDKLVIDTTPNSSHYVSQTVGSYSIGDYITVSVYASKGEYSQITLGFSGSAAFPSTANYCAFDLNTGAMFADIGTIFSYSATSCPGGVWRLSVTAVATGAGAAQCIFIISDPSASGAQHYTFPVGDGVSGIYLWGAQCEKGTMATSYIPTTTAAVTRDAESFSSAAANRPLGYMDWWQSYTYDSGVVSANTSTTPRIAGLTLTQSSSAYNYGGGRSITLYTTPVTAYNVRVDISDPLNLQGYLEASRLVIGEYFSPVYDAEVGTKISFEDTGKNFRNDAGNLMSDIGTRNKLVDVNVGMMQEVDRAALWKIVAYCGTSYPVFMSVYPGNANKDLEQAYTVYGKFSNISKLAAKSYGVWEAPLTVEGI